MKFIIIVIVIIIVIIIIIVIVIIIVIIVIIVVGIINRNDLEETDNKWVWNSQRSHQDHAGRQDHNIEERMNLGLKSVHLWDSLMIGSDILWLSDVYLIQSDSPIKIPPNYHN